MVHPQVGVQWNNEPVLPGQAPLSCQTGSWHVAGIPWAPHLDWGLLDVVREGWEQQRDVGTQLLQYLADLWQQLSSTQKITEENLQRDQVRQKVYYSHRTQEYMFKVGDRVLVLLPDQNSWLLSERQGHLRFPAKSGWWITRLSSPGIGPTWQIFHVKL